MADVGRMSIRMYSKDRSFLKITASTRTLDARCPNAKFVHKNSLCFTETIIFQLLCCLYIYDSGMLGPVCIRKQRLYTVRWRGSTIHRAAGIPSSGACGNEPFGRYTAVRRRREVCAQSVYRLPASKGLINGWVTANDSVSQPPFCPHLWICKRMCQSSTTDLRCHYAQFSEKRSLHINKWLSYGQI